MNKGFCMMAFAKGQTVGNSVVAPKYIGVAPVSVLAVNPNKAELEKLYNRTIDEEPNYLTETRPDENGKTYSSVRINFIVKTNPNNEESKGIEFITGVNFFIQKKYKFGSKSGKYQIIDKYGRTAWATKEEIENKQIPTYSNGPANIDVDYRPCYDGEAELTSFIKNYLGIPDVQIYANGAWVPNPKYSSEECEARLSNIDSYFKGDFSELKELISYQPNNNIKLLFGVRNAEDNKQYQSVFTQYTMKNFNTNYSRLEKELQERKAAGAYSTTEFKVGPLEEYKIQATKFEPSTDNSDLPFGDDSESESPW